MKEERTETWNPYELPEQPSVPEWYPDSRPEQEQPRFDPRGPVDPVTQAVRLH